MGELQGVDIRDLARPLPSYEKVEQIRPESPPSVRPEPGVLDSVGLRESEGVEAILIRDGTRPAPLLGAVAREAVFLFQGELAATS